MPGLTLVRRDQDWTVSATMTATSEQAGYEATNAQTDDPSVPWVASSGTATLTATLGASRSVGMIALVGVNADDGKTITIGGGITGSPTLTGARDASGASVDLVYILPTAQTLSTVTIAIAGNSAPFSIGRLVVGGAQTIGRTFHVGAYGPYTMRPQYVDENDFGHTIRYDLGVQRNGIKGKLRLHHETDLLALQNVVNASRFGFYPTLIVPNIYHVGRYPPMWVRFPATLAYDYYAPNMAEVSLDLIEEPKVEVV